MRSFGDDPVEAQLQVRAGKAQRVSDGRFLPVDEPLVHGPEVALAHVDLQVVHDLGHQRQLLRGPDRPAQAGRGAGRRLLPRAHVLQRLGDVEGLQRVIESHRESRAAKAGADPGGEPRGIVQDRRVQRRVVPPALRHLARCSASLFLLSRSMRRGAQSPSRCPPLFRSAASSQ